MDLLPTLGSLLDEHGLIAIFDALGELCAQRHEPVPPPPETQGRPRAVPQGLVLGVLMSAAFNPKVPQFQDPLATAMALVMALLMTVMIVGRYFLPQ
jgi:hypothetical protein